MKRITLSTETFPRRNFPAHKLSRTKLINLLLTRWKFFHLFAVRWLFVVATSLCAFVVTNLVVGITNIISRFKIKSCDGYLLSLNWHPNLHLSVISSSVQFLISICFRKTFTNTDRGFGDAISLRESSCCSMMYEYRLHECRHATCTKSEGLIRSPRLHKSRNSFLGGASSFASRTTLIYIVRSRC